MNNWNDDHSNIINNNNNSLTTRPCCKSAKSIEMAYKQFTSIPTSIQDQSVNH